MTITSLGYGGSGQSINTVQWAKVAPHMGSAPHIVKGMTVTVTSAVDRTVTVGVGSGAGWGVYDSVTAAETLTLASQTGTTPRWDAIVLHRDWQTPPGATTLRVVPGTVQDAQVMPVGLDATPGVVADQVIAFVPVTSTGAAAPAMSGFYAAGSPVYMPFPVDPDPAWVQNGQLVVTYGNPDRLLLRRGTDSSPVFDDVLNPPWTPLGLSSEMRARGSGQIPSARVCNGKLELSGAVLRANVADSFQARGGVDGQYELGVFPSRMLPSTVRNYGTSSGDANVTLVAGQYGNWVQAYVRVAATPVIYLDGFSVRL